ncbi:tRNA pseudouridine(38-40) synthase TruA [Desulfonispora thiosulfatigenes]|nr:tRNA pseudouridine(38-40) synthase TruA [Desulfonispora thiosulfatigenes]
MKRNIKLTIQYDGTNYYGFQRQAGRNIDTIQGKLELCLAKVFKEPIKVRGSGRTDGGVHAEGQVVSFFTTSVIPVEKIALALNHRLPRDIIALKAEEVDLNFHAQYHAFGKKYVYSFYQGVTPSPFYRLYSYFVPYQLDFEKMEAACTLLKGTHNFKAFSSSGSNVKTFERTIYDIDLIKNGNHWQVSISGNGFLYNMVRIIVGALIDIGRGRLDISCIEEALETTNRNLLGKKAPPHGLCLKEVYYSPINYEE